MKLKTLSATIGALALGMTLTQPLLASSHREAPLITGMPKVDGTDFYMFRSYETGRAGFVTVIANYLPLQAAYGGPNYFDLQENALYEIHLDQNGDSVEDLTYSFQFTTALKDLSLPVGVCPGVACKTVSVPLKNIGQISAENTDALNVSQSYTIRQITGDRRTGTKQAVLSGGQRVMAKPADNIGEKSIPDYEEYASNHINDITLPGCATPGKVFVGQRRESFSVNLGEVFDLVNLDPLSEPDAAYNTLEDSNVTSIIMELPISCLTPGTEKVIGGWTTASLRQAQVLNPKPSLTRPSTHVGGAWTQVSRLGMPLVNEVVIGIKDKDRFNASEPKDDGQFIDYVTHPTFPELLEILFEGTAVAPNLFPRTDLVTAFLTGVPGLNQPAAVVGSEMLRLNTSIEPKAANAQSNLGVLGGDTAGFPNGRRPGDDVVDVVLRVAMGFLIDSNVTAPNRRAPLTDGATVNAEDFSNEFPYLLDPIPGAGNGAE